ncbi:hypothetical protein MKX83_17370 [Cytobacillus sp. FSL M8-0252]|uniref:hypothetical protein n=1 Tax=Cytobacillus sp. FSL M8-0252 TaxID=2921621 RepID=UPI0030FA6BDA
MPELSRNQKAALVILLHYEEERRKARERMLLGKAIDPTEKLQEGDLSGETAKILSKKVGITSRYMYQLLAVYKSRLDLFQLVKDGKYSINKAYTQMKADEAPEVVEEVPVEILDVDEWQAEYLLIAENVERRGQAESDPIKKARIAQFLKEYWGVKNGRPEKLGHNGQVSKTTADIAETIGESEKSTRSWRGNIRNWATVA